MTTQQAVLDEYQNILEGIIKDYPTTGKTFVQAVFISVMTENNYRSRNSYIKSISRVCQIDPVTVDRMVELLPS